MPNQWHEAPPPGRPPGYCTVRIASSQGRVPWGCRRASTPAPPTSKEGGRAPGGRESKSAERWTLSMKAPGISPGPAPSCRSFDAQRQLKKAHTVGCVTGFHTRTPCAEE